jgi:hypothetical protein
MLRKRGSTWTVYAYDASPGKKVCLGTYALKKDALRAEAEGEVEAQVSVSIRNDGPQGRHQSINKRWYEPADRSE